MAYCVKCGAALQAQARFCIGCGAPTAASAGFASANANRGPASPLSSAAAAPPPAKVEGAPHSMWAEFTVYVLKRLPLVGITFGLSWLAHLYLIYLNNGYAAGKVTGWTPYVNVGSNPGSSALLIWTSLSALGWSFISTVFSQGPIRAMTSVVMQPVNLVKKLFSSSRSEYACWALGGGIALWAAAALGTNRPAGFSVAMIWAVLGFSQAGQMLAQLIFGGLTQVLTGHLGRFKPSVELIQVLVASVAPGFAIAGVFASPQLDVLTGLVAIGVGVFLFFYDKRGARLVPAAGQVSTLVLVACGGAAAYVIMQLLWPRLVFAHDFGKAENGSFWNALKSGTDTVIQAAKNAAKVAAGAGAGALAPPIKPPRVYGRTDPATGELKSEPNNPWDPSTEEQIEKWKKDHVIWDPKTLSFRPPEPGEYPPPAGPPEYRLKTPFENEHPRESIPPDCLELYDKYVKAESTAQSGASDLKRAADAYQKAQAAYNMKLQMWTLIMGAEIGQIAAGGVAGVRAAGAAAESAGAAAREGIGEATRKGLREAADRAAVEAAAAETEVNNLSAEVTQLRQMSLDATAEASTASNALETLKASGVTKEQAAVDSASEEVQAAEKAEAEAEGDLDISRKAATNARKDLDGPRKDVEFARNKVQRVKDNVARGKQLTVVENERKALNDEYYKAFDEKVQVKSQADALRDERVAAAQRELKLAADAATDKEAGELWMKSNDLKNEIRQLDQQLEGFRKARTGQIQPGAYDAAVARRAELGEELEKVEARAKELDSQGYRQSINNKIREDVANQPLPPEEAELRAKQQQFEAKEQAAVQKLNENEEEQARLRRQIDPSYDDPSYLDAAEQEQKNAEQQLHAAEHDVDTLEDQWRKNQDAAKQAHQDADAARGKLKEANQKLNDAQQNNQSKIDEQQAKVKQANEKVNSLAQKESDASQKLKQAEQKKTEALQRKQDAESAYQKSVQGSDTPPDAGQPSGTPGPGQVAAGPAAPIGPGTGSGQHNSIVDPKTGRTIDVGDNYIGSGRPLVDQQTGKVVTIDTNYDPWHDQREALRKAADKLDPLGAQRAKWTQEKMAQLAQAFGVSSPEEAAEVLAKAKAELDSTYQAYQDQMKAYGQACDDLGLVGMGDNWTSLHNVEPGENFWDKFAQQAKDGLKGQLDQCIQAHTFWKGDASAGGSSDGSAQ